MLDGILCTFIHEIQGGDGENRNRIHKFEEIKSSERGAEVSHSHSK